MNLLYFLAIAAALASLGNAISLKKKTGAPVEKNPFEPKYRIMARISFDKWLNDNKRLFDAEAILVYYVTEQLVAGLLTRLDFFVADSNVLMQCHSEVWDKEWEHFRQIKIDCHIVYTNKRKIQQQKSGSRDDQSPKKGTKGLNVEEWKDPRDPKYEHLARQSFDKWLDERQKLFNYQLIDVKNVTEQPVAGTLTRINFIVFGTTGELMGCHSEVWERQWLQSRDVTNVYCLDIEPGDLDQRKQRPGGLGDKSPKKISTPGGEVEKDSNDPKYRKMAHDSFDKWLDEHITIMEIEYIDVKKVTEQVVAGLITRLDFLVFGAAGELIGCHSDVYDIDWEDFRDIEIDCLDVANGDYVPTKKQPGGIEHKSTNKGKSSVQRQDPNNREKWNPLLSVMKMTF